MTLQLRDIRGERRDVPVGPRVPVTIAVLASTDVRRTLTRALHADLLRRAAERHDALPELVVIGDQPPGTGELLAALNCRPAAPWAGRAHVVVGADGPDEAIVCEPAESGALLTHVGLDVRLAMLDRTDDVVAAAAELDRWRAVVAVWAESPSKPMCADYVGWCHDAIDDDLDTPRLLRLMREVESHPELPPGSKFETFAHLDRLVGLDLAGQVGLGDSAASTRWTSIRLVPPL
ncbi:MAG TPA: hypothetical protein VNA12_08940 [Mycobacteriales bacterium]|nr:hypothetical protein [Mycobacteriales bacterium]